ncbi:MAG: glycosyltransferase family 4 protein [Gemmatimonadaceae bacterium]|nr:glycosyltransferase family 4 protein [Acetobacteraceae bacterium]
MRICFVSRRFFPAISGMSVYALNLLRELVGAGHDVTMISQYRGDAFGRRVYGGGPPPDVPGVRVIGLEQMGEQDGGDFERDVAAMVAAIVAEHAREPFDVLHAQYGYPNGWAVLEASRILGIPNVVSIQGGDGHWVGSCCETHRLAMTRVLDHAGAVLIGCDSFAQEVVDRLGTARSRFTIVPGAVDVDRFFPGPVLDHDPPVMLYHGRVDARKGVLDLLDAARQLRDTGDAFRLLISGIGPTYDETAASIPLLGLQDQVAMTGHVEYADVPAVYRRADIFVSPTYAEGFSNTILEAMASRMAIVSCRSVGVVDCIRDAENGLLTEPGDRDALADALRRVLRDTALRHRLADAALHECRAVYSWTKVGRQIMDVYAAVAGTTPDLDWSPELPFTPCRFRAEPHLL